MDRIFELASPPGTSAQLKNLPSSPQSKTTRAQKASTRHVASHPAAKRTLDRPFHNLSGRRHVPVLINANRVPFLRLTKPQPPFLNRIIRDTVKTREHRLTGADRLTREIPIAEDEDEWDQILCEHFGLDYEEPQEDPWQREVKQAFDENHRVQIAAINKRADISAKMYAIVEQEKALAEKEKLRIRDEKHKARKARRLARRGLSELMIHEKLYPQDEKWRKRGDKYHTSDELRRLYEASLRPKTDEERAKIKEARVIRKEEEAIRRAKKMKRKQEAIARQQKLNNQAEHSTNERLNSERLGETGKKGSISEALRSSGWRANQVHQHTTTARNVATTGGVRKGQWCGTSQVRYTSSIITERKKQESLTKDQS